MTTIKRTAGSFYSTFFYRHTELYGANSKLLSYILWKQVQSIYDCCGGRLLYAPAYSSYQHYKPFFINALSHHERYWQKGSKRHTWPAWKDNWLNRDKIEAHI